jgi:hypothetical protein
LVRAISYKYTGSLTFDLAYPLPDSSVRNYLQLAPSADDELTCKAYLKSFLVSLFNCFGEWVLGAFPKKSAYLTMAMTVYKLFRDKQQRKAFYDNVLERSTPESNNVSSSLTKTISILSSRCSNWPEKIFPVVLSLDEVHPLFRTRFEDTPGSHTVFSRLKSVLSELVGHALCVLCLSTVSSVAALAPSSAAADSFREKREDIILPTPFTELAFDAHIIDNPLKSQHATLQTVGTLEFTAMFGRPMYAFSILTNYVSYIAFRFYSTYLARKAQEENQGKICNDLLNVARTKLSAHVGPLKSQATLDASSIAILSSRLLLDISPTSSLAREYEEAQVRSHLRLLYSVHQNHEMIASGSSPEPLIAEASAQLMHASLETKDMPFMDVWNLVIQFVDEGFLPQGTIGELLGRVISIVAMDRAIEGVPIPCELKYQTPVTVVEYYKALLTDEAWNTLKDSTPANYSDLCQESGTKRFEDAFAGAYFHFSHYAKASDETPMQDQFAWALWLRGTAVLCQLNQKLTNRAHPIFFSAPNREVSAKWMSMALEQDKTGQNENPMNAGSQNAEILGLFTKRQKLPYIATVHCYALTKDEGVVAFKINRTEVRWKSVDNATPRYQIDFRGLSAYRGLSGTMPSTIRTMIDNTKNAIFKNHPRQKTIDGVRMMLPLLNEHPFATAWINGLPGDGHGRLAEVDAGGRSSSKRRKLE